MGAATQTYRQVAIGSSLGDDVLLFRRATVMEQLGRPFHIEVDVLSENPDIPFKDIVGHNATIRLTQQDGNTRYFNGFVTRFIHTGGTSKVAHYRMTLSPWLWYLTRIADCRIFQDKSVKDIIMEVFRGRGFSDFSDALKSTYKPRTYCVQYRETDFNFVSRLMEEEGIYYYFEHRDGKHILVLADGYGSHEPYPGYATFPYYPPTDQVRDQEYVSEWAVEQEIQPGVYSHTDYNFEKPTQPMLALAEQIREHAVPRFEVYDYPGGYLEQPDGETISRIRLEEYQCNHEIVRARCDLRGACVGYTFTLEGFPRESQNKEHLITSAVYQIESDEYASSVDGEPGAPIYTCSFTAILASQQFRPRRLTPKPRIHGIQTAFVTGPEGEEIHTDQHARVKVKFHWDHSGKTDDTTSCWVRVSQGLAGAGWGMLYLPRVGQEVIVDFLEGDPDQPLIVGRVYNGDCKPPYELPANKTLLTLKSNSTKGGGGFNEIRFDDMKDQEQIFIHAQRDQHIRVRRNVHETIANNRHLIIQNDQFERVGNDRHEIVDNDHKEQIGNHRSLKVGGDERKEVVGKQSLKVGGDVGEEFGGNHSEITGGDYYLKASNICIEAEDNITIKVGSSFIAIESDSITISSQTIDVEAAATLTLKGTQKVMVDGPAEVEVSAGQCTVSASGNLTLKGAAVMIN